MTILFTRSIENEAIKRLEMHNYSVSMVDFLKINPLETGEKDILKYKNTFKNLVFTSKHAVRYFFNFLKKEQIILKNDVKIFSTSGETLNAIKKYGYTPTLSAPAAKPLAELMLQKADITEGVHFIGGTLSLPILPNILIKNNILLTKITLYETVKNTAPLPLSTFDAVAFFSLSAVDAFLIKNSLSDTTMVFTLGKTTAQHIREKTGIKHIFVAKTPTIDSIITKIIEILNTK